MASIISIPNGSIGFDLSGSKLNYALANSYVSKGYKFCIRYVPNPLSPGDTDLSNDETGEILAAGLLLGAVQHCSAATKTSTFGPTGDMGSEWGSLAAQCSVDAGLATGTTVWLDLEGVQSETAAADIIAFCNQWFGQVAQAGFSPGLYVGFDCGLSSDQLYLQLTTQHYWRAPSAAPDISVRGYQLTQRILQDADGNTIDFDTARDDALGLSAKFTSA
jgi:hypothetical protein